MARLGGDEFAVIVHDIDDTAVAEDFAKKINELLQDSNPMDSVLCKVNASIGITIYPDSGKDSETLLRNADSAMYDVKRKGKSGVGIFMNQPK